MPGVREPLHGTQRDVSRRPPLSPSAGRLSGLPPVTGDSFVYSSLKLNTRVNSLWKHHPVASRI